MPAPAMPTCDPPPCRLSVLVAVMDRGEIVPCLNALAAQKGVAFEEFEVWVADATPGRSWQTRARRAIDRRGAALRWHVVESRMRSRAAALNEMMRRAAGSILLFLADDFIPDPKLVARHLHFHDRHPEIHRGAVGPGLFPQPYRKSDFMRWLEDSGALFGVPFTDTQLSLPRAYFYAGNTSVKRALVDQAGIFEERFPYDAWDDYEMGLRLVSAGYRADYLPKAVCTHEHRVTLAARAFQVGLGGESAAIYDSFHNDVQPWHTTVRRVGRISQLERWRALAAAWLQHLLEPGDAESRVAYYRLRLELAFVRGYERRTEEGAAQPVPA